MTTAKKKVTLKFSCFYTTWTYIRTVHLQFYELDYIASILQGQCTDEQIALAVNTFGATIVSRTFTKEESAY